VRKALELRELEGLRYREIGEVLAMSLNEVKACKNRLGGTLNDVVLAIVAGAMRRFLRARGENVEQLDFRCMVPVSVRADEQRGTLGNRVSAWIVPMPLDERDARRPRRRDGHAGLGPFPAGRG
jgi:hypothetical protein